MAYGSQVLWADHAIQGSAKAALHHDLDLARVEVIIRKGFHRDIDSYSTFFENDRRTPTGLDGWLRQRGFRRVFLAGLATDFCVAWTALDARAAGFEVVLSDERAMSQKRSPFRSVPALVAYITSVARG